MAFKARTSKKLAKADFYSRLKSSHDVRVHLHTKLFAEVKQMLRVRSVEMEMPIQQMFECLAQAIVDEDPHIMKKLNRYKLDLESGESKLFSQQDADSIFKAIAEGNKEENVT